MSRMRWILLILLIALFMAGCRQQTPDAADANLNIDLHLDPESPTVGEANLIVTVNDSAGNPVSDAKVSARGDMNHAGMVPVIKDADSSQNGEYNIPFEWTMAGDWTVEITVELADGTKASKTFDQSVAASGDSGAMDMGDEATETMNMDMTAEATEAMDMSGMDSMADATPTMEMSESSG